MRRGTVQAWYLVHKWTSLVCTLFLLMLCLTGLPLIFHDEIEALTGGPPPLTGPASSSDAPGLLTLDAMLQRALTVRPGEVPLYMAFDNATPLLTVTAQTTVTRLAQPTVAVTEPQGGTTGFGRPGVVRYWG